MTLSLRCPAKVNLALSVGPPQVDGMHPVASWMVTVDLYDTLDLARSPSGRTTFSIRWADDAPQSQPIDWPLERDLAFRAHGLLQRRAACELPVVVTLRKRIPAGAGLGGGSADAAAMLHGLDTLFKMGLHPAELRELAMQLGSDVAFAAAGEISALVSGLGERVEPLPARVLHMVLVLPPLTCPTGAVYHRFDELGDAKLDDRRVRRLATLDPLPAEALFNDLADAAMAVEPRLADVHRRVGALLQRPVHITGSGAAMFVLAPDADTAQGLARRIREELDLPAVATCAGVPVPPRH